MKQSATPERQARRFGAEILVARAVVGLEPRPTAMRGSSASTAAMRFARAASFSRAASPGAASTSRSPRRWGRDVMDLVAAKQGERTLPRDSFLRETSIPGVFSAGDERHGSVKRVASGVGEGDMAIAFVHQFMETGR